MCGSNATPFSAAGFGAGASATPAGGGGRRAVRNLILLPQFADVARIADERVADDELGQHLGLIGRHIAQREHVGQQRPQRMMRRPFRQRAELFDLSGQIRGDDVRGLPREIEVAQEAAQARPVRSARDARAGLR